MTHLDALIELAKAYGIAPSYTDSGGKTVTATADTLVKLLRAMGVKLGEAEEPAESDIQAARQAVREELATRPLPLTVAAVAGDAKTFDVHVHHGSPAEVAIVCEDGTRREVAQEHNWREPVTVAGVTWGEATFRLPTDLPTGYHTITLHSDGLEASTRLIVSPARLSTADAYVSDPRFGVMAQLYSVRSEASWGIGDFRDLGLLAETVATEIGADFLLVNPLHAAEPAPPVEDSPYLPTTRRFTNPIYLHVEDVPEYAQADEQVRAEIDAAAKRFHPLNRSGEVIDRDPIYAAKLDALRALHAVTPTAERREAFVAYRDTEGQGLADFAQWCARHGGDHGDGPAADELVDFYMWLQFLCDEQLAAAQRRAVDAGMAVGVVTDLAVGVHPGGADAHNLAPWLAADASVGAPPDGYNQQGQDWSQPPWNPAELAAAGYEPWREMINTVLRHAGGVRADHILGLFRLFWMPRMQHPSTGTYVNYDYEAMVGVLTLEAERAGAVVIGEDLGTFEPWVQDVLASRGVLGTSVLWFESSDREDGPRHQDEYRQLALSAVGTHDLPPTAGYLVGEHIRLRDELGLLTTDAADEETEDLRWQGQVLDRARQAGCFAGTDAQETTFTGLARGERGDVADLLVGLHRFMAGTPSALTVTNLVDLVGDVQIQNQPGTNSEQHPNWRLPLADGAGKVVLIEDLADNELFRRVGAASRRG